MRHFSLFQFAASRQSRRGKFQFSKDIELGSLKAGNLFSHFDTGSSAIHCRRLKAPRGDSSAPTRRIERIDTVGGSGLPNITPIYANWLTKMTRQGRQLSRSIFAKPRHSRAAGPYSIAHLDLDFALAQARH